MTRACQQIDPPQSLSRPSRPSTHGMSEQRPKVVVVNAGRLDWDGALDWAELERTGAVVLHPDGSPLPAELAARCDGATVVVTKEVKVDVDLLPSSVKLICEAGTGYNNVNLAAATARGITVCNVPAYSTEAVALLGQADFVSIHIPLSEATHHLMGKTALASMKKGAYLINTARGAIVDEAALIDALRSGHLAGAGLDVQETEPPAEDSPLWGTPNLILTPHIGWKRVETRQRLIDAVARNVQAWAKGAPINVVA